MRIGTLTRVGLTLILGTGAVLAADVAKGDVFGQVGAYTETGQGGGTWAIFGGGASAHFGSRVAVFGELNYASPTAVTTDPIGARILASGSLYEAGGGVRFFIPTRNDKVRLYVPAVGGWLRASATAFVPFLGFGISQSGNGGYVGSGFGAEVAVTPRFGLRPEFRVFREFFGAPGSDDTAMIFSTGVYCRFGKR